MYNERVYLNALEFFFIITDSAAVFAVCGQFEFLIFRASLMLRRRSGYFQI